MGFLTKLLQFFFFLCYFLQAQIYWTKGAAHLHKVTYLDHSKGGQNGISCDPQSLATLYCLPGARCVSPPPFCLAVKV